MFKSKSFRSVIVFIAIFSVSAIVFASAWTPGFWADDGRDLSTQVVSAEPLVIGTCDLGNLIDVEATNSANNAGYATLGAALAAINAGTHTGSITIEVCGNTDELSATALLSASGTGASSYTDIAIRPVGGVARTITGATTAGAPLIDLNGADNVTINGLNTGGNSLTIANTTVSATSVTSTIRFIGGATNNTITNSSILGSGTMSVATNGANIFFSTDALTTSGNDNNTISNNNIGPAGANLPTKGILCNGSTTTTAIGNSGNIVNNNNIFDFFGAAVTSSGVAANGGCNAWTITNNRFYQTGTRTWTTGATHRAIDINNSTATSGAQGFTITGNIVGYASNTQTGTYTLTGSTGKFQGIQFSGITGGTVSNISNNTVAAVSLTGVTSSGTGTSSPLLGLMVTNGNSITSNNTIGSQAAAGPLTLSTTTTTATDVYGIFNFSVDNWTANSNTVGGLAVTNLGASGTFVVYGMRANTGTAVQFSGTSNTVGGSVADSIQLTSTGTASQVVGMQTSNAISTWTSNTIRNLTNNNGTGTSGTASVIGMLLTSATPNQNLSQNTIFNLNNTNATAATTVTGIQFTGGTVNVVERNFIYGLTSATNSAVAEINGIRVAGGTTNYRNNMIAFGAGVTNAIGSVASNSATSGINGINGALGTDSFFHNSVYIGGAPTAGTGASYAFNGTQTVNARSFRDNIFFNARSNSGATGTNYAIKINGTTANPTGLTINNNIYFVNGTGGVFGFFNGADVLSLSAWRTAVGQDASSFSLNPSYNDATNAVPDLHLNPTVSTPAEGNGSDVGVINDFDGQTRAGLTPVDIGADAGNFNGVDLSAPAISYTALGNTNLTTNRSLSVAITDFTGVATGGLAPRIYFNKNAGAYSSTPCALASGTTQSGTWTCTIDYSLLGGVVTADVVRYFVVAQDIGGLLASNPGAGFSGTDVNNVTPPTTPNSYLIAAAISGTRTVCASGCDFTTLTGATGIFNAINTGVATGNINIEIGSDLIVGEDGTNGLNSIAEEPAGSNFTVRMYPTGAPRAITGAFNGALIRLRGASRVTIDGSLAGTGTDRSLTITNTSVTTPSVVLIGSLGATPVTNDAVRNCIVINGVNTSSAVVISDATTSGTAGLFSNITIQNNSIQRAFVGVFAQGGTTPQGGSNLTYSGNNLDTSGANAIRNIGLYMQGVSGATVSNNTLGNFSNAEGENDTGIWLASGTTNTTVSGNTVNNLGMTLTTAFAPFGIRESSGATVSGNNISGNTVSNLSTTGSTGLRGITSGSNGVTIQRNIVTGIINNNTSTFGSFGIDVLAGNDNIIRNNFVSNVNHNMTGGVAFDPNFGVIGIRLGAGTGHRVYNNSVNLFGPHTGTATTSLLSAAFSISATTQTGIDVRNNIFANNITGGTTLIAHVAAFLPSGGTSTMNLTWNNNSYYYGADAASGAGQSGTTPSSPNLPTLPLLAAYTSSLGTVSNDNASIASTGAVPFMTSTNLHIPTSAAEVSAGATIATVTDDIDGDLRFAPYEIGADEFPDTTAPDTMILSSPPNPSNSSSATFAFTGTDSAIATVASFQCQIDGAAFSTCTSPQNYTGLAQGSHTFNVRTVDGAGNVDPTPATYTWSVDAIAPDTTIVSGPTNPSNSSSATFIFSGTDSVVATVASFQCSLDSSTFATCVSPTTYNGLSQGSHNFQVRTVDGAGNLDPSPASYTWVVDAIAPETTINTGPPNPSTSTSATFTFSGTDSVVATVASFQCSLDSATFTVCTSPITYTGLAQGGHSFMVRTIDGAGTPDPTPATYNWAVDALAPETTLLTFPTNPSSSADATFTFSGVDSVVAGASVFFDCSLDGSAFAACTSPTSYTGLADGSHTFIVRARDSVGNVDPTPASYTWTISTAPAGPVTVTATAGTPTGTYTNLTTAIAAVNDGTHQGAIVVSINQTITEPATVVINGSGAGAAIYTSLLIRPTADGLSDSGATVSGRGLIELNGADNVTIDGDNPNTAGTNRNLTLQNTAANTVTFTSVIRVAVAATVVTSADNNAFRNLNILGSATGRNVSTATSTTGSENTTFGIIAGPGASTVAATTAPAAVTSVSTSVAAGATAANLIVANNNITTAARGVTVNGAATTVFPGLQITGNRIGNSVAGATDQVYSIGVTAQGSANGIIFGNTVWVEGFVASSVATHGIEVGVNSPNATFTIDSNRVNRARNLNGATWAAYGINLGGGSNHIVQNNFVSGVINDQTAGTGGFGTTFGAYGIRVASGTGHRIYHNSVNLYGALGGVTSTNLTVAFMVVGTTQTGVDVRNNIFANTITGGNPAGTRNVAVYIPSTATVAMNLTDNNNAYFVSTDVNSRLAQTVATFGTGEYLAANFDPTTTSPASNFRAFTSTLSAAGTNDNASFASTALPPFTSNVDLHIPASTQTRLESGGATVGVATDIDAEVRNGSTPDIGADEFAGLPPAANDIAATALVTPANGATLTVGATFAPQATFNNNGTATQTSVTVRYRIIDASTAVIYNQTSTIATIAPLQNVTVTFPSTSLPAAGTFTIQASAELAGDANVGNDTISGTVTAVAPLGGTVSVGAGETYTSLTNPGGIFQALNTAGISANTVINITSDLTGETGTVGLNQLAESGVGGYTVTIKPSGAARSISGTTAATGGLIKLNGADNVTIDGSLSGGTDRSLTINQAGAGAIIWISTTGTNGSNNDTVRNTVLIGSGTSQGVIAGDGVTLGGAGTAPQNNNTLQNNNVRAVQNAAFISGIAATDTNWTIVDNEVGSTIDAEKLSFRGFILINSTNLLVSRNRIIGVRSGATSTATMSGVQVAGTIVGGQITRNEIRDIKQINPTGLGSNGIYLTAGSTTSSLLVANNFVADVASQGAAGVLATNNGYGIAIAGGGGYNIYHNSVNMNTDQVSAASTTAALNITSAVTTAGSIDLRNNILVSTQMVGTRYAVIDNSTQGAAVFSTINYNDYLAQNVGFLTSARVTLADWQTATTQDANSLAVDPLFIAPTNLHIQPTSPMVNVGGTGTGVTTDFDGQTRDATPDIGADEIIPVVVPGTLALSSATYSVSEVATTVTITVNRTVGTNGAVGATYSFTDGTATGGAACGAGIDFVNTGGTVSFANGAATQTFVVTLCPDSLNKVDETFNVALSAPTGGAIIGTPASAVVTITNDDPLPSFSINDVSLAEGNAGITSFTFTIARTGGTTIPTTVDVQTADGTAVSSSDYQASNFTVTFQPTDTTKSVTIQVNGDTTVEADETFFVNLQNPSGATIGDGQGLGTILNDDAAAGAFTINDVRKVEGNAGASNAVFTVTYSAGSAATVGYATANRTATVGTDYTLTTGTLTFPASGSAQTQTVSVPVIGDLVKEANETFFLNLSAATGGATIADNQGVGIIVDEDRPYVSDFDRDLFADYSVFRPSNGAWYILQSSNGVPNVVTFGASTDRPVPADYDGDGKTDIAYYRPSTSAWSILNSSTSTVANYTVGVAGDKPVQGDYNGDGRADLATFRPSTGVWSIFFTNDGGSASQAFGISTDRLVQADYDGDAKTDLAVYRDGIWYILQSSTGSVRIESWGVAGDRPVIGDFNGDGQNDLTIYRNGAWWTVNSLTGAFSVTSWGLATDIPVPADYDLDGSTDVAVYRPADGDWYILRSSNNTITGVHWGSNGDIPVPSAYIPQ